MARHNNKASEKAISPINEDELHEYIKKVLAMINRVGSDEHKALTQKLVATYPKTGSDLPGYKSNKQRQKNISPGLESIQ